jgi:uncharacterized protein (DUF1778 family)
VQTAESAFDTPGDAARERDAYLMLSRASNLQSTAATSSSFSLAEAIRQAVEVLERKQGQ